MDTAFPWPCQREIKWRNIIEVLVNSCLCYWPCLVGFLWVGFFVLVWHWFMLTCDPQLPISFLQASSVASCSLVFMLFITSVEMLIFVFLFTKLHSLELYWILILWFLAASTPCPRLVSFTDQLRGVLTVPMFRLSVKILIVLDPGQIPVEHCSIFSYNLIVN